MSAFTPEVGSASGPAVGQKVIQFHYTLKNAAGETLESSIGEDPMRYLEGVGQVIPGLEAALANLKKGDKKTIEVAAVDAYGEFEEDLIAQVPRAQLPKKDVEIGDQFHAQDADGKPTVVTVTAVTDHNVSVDGNHPLAGQALTFEVEITDVRPATKEELSHGHAHGGDGHHHH